MKLSLRWAERCKRAFEGAAPGRALFGIVQGGDDHGLRAESARELVDIGFDGYAIGGLAVGEPQEVMFDVVAETAPRCPPIGRATSWASARRPIFWAPSRAASTCSIASCRPATAATASPSPGSGRSTSRNAHHADDPRPLDRDEPLPGRARFLARLSASSVPRAARRSAARCLSIVNLFYYQDLMAGARAAIAAGRFADYAAATAGTMVGQRRSTAGLGGDPHTRKGNPPAAGNRKTGGSLPTRPVQTQRSGAATKPRSQKTKNAFKQLLKQRRSPRSGSILPGSKMSAPAHCSHKVPLSGAPRGRRGHNVIEVTNA